MRDQEAEQSDNAITMRNRRDTLHALREFSPSPSISSCLGMSTPSVDSEQVFFWCELLRLLERRRSLSAALSAACSTIECHNSTAASRMRSMSPRKRILHLPLVLHPAPFPLCPPPHHPCTQVSHLQPPPVPLPSRPPTLTPPTHAIGPVEYATRQHGRYGAVRCYAGSSTNALPTSPSDGTCATAFDAYTC